MVPLKNNLESSKAKNILIIYCLPGFLALQASIRDHLYSFKNYSNNNCIYLNVGIRKIPKCLKRIKLDLIIFHTSFLGQRWSRSYFLLLKDRVRELKDMAVPKIILPQDEFINTYLLNDFCNEFSINHIFSVAPESEWDKIYSSINPQMVAIHNVLTGYLENKIVKKINSFGLSTEKRPIDIGYRTKSPRYWLGRHGMLKTDIAEKIQFHAKHHDLSTDISTQPKDSFWGDKWYKFLLKCKYTIGVEGGASILDINGDIREKTIKYLAQKPDASFDEVESHCFQGLDGNLGLRAISPRHLEACSTKTCQILFEGRYNDILIPGKHFIEIKNDFSNIEEVLKIAKEDKLREEIVERAYKDIVESGKYTYERFVDYVLRHSNINGDVVITNLPQSFQNAVIFKWLSIIDMLSWPYKRFLSLARAVLLAIFGERNFKKIENIYFKILYRR